jgi:CubicO group peptidase (beta-lactamase class C family)
MTIDIQGSCELKFNRVKDAFAASFENGEEVGSAVAITLDGKPVVDLWAGHADQEKTRPWTRDTIANVYSTTKGLIAICAHRLVDQGKLDFDAPVARYWPEFAQAGKDAIPVRWLFSHRAGVPAVRTELAPDALFDWDAMCTALAAQEPWWEPGTKHGYHALTYGWLAGEVIHRITGKTPGTYFHDELAKPLGLDAHIGLGAEHDARVANLIPSPPPPPGQPNLWAEVLQKPESMLAKAFANPKTMLRPGLVNSREWRAAEIPGANGHTEARSLARLYGALSRGGEVDGYRVLSPEAIARCHVEQSCGLDEVLRIDTRFSLGFMMSLPEAEIGPNPRSFGHPGAGGSLGYADPDAKIGFGYVMNRMGTSILIDSRVTRLIDALYQSL